MLIPKGLDLTDFHKNPVVLYIHEQGRLPIGRAVNIRKSQDEVTARVIFAERPSSLHPVQEWVPDTVHELFKQGVLRAFSVGFEIKVGGSRMAEKSDAMRFGEGVKRVIDKWKLVEFSVVPIGSNQDALAIAVSKGFLPKSSIVRNDLGMFDDTLDMLDGRAPPLEIECPRGAKPPLDISR